MRKPSMIIEKKHIILASLTLVLGVAVYMNYVFSDVQDSLTQDALSDGGDELSYGDAAYVSADADAESMSGDDYFSQARLSRMTSRDDAV